jgi:hypothetical protein
MNDSPMVGWNGVVFQGAVPEIIRCVKLAPARTPFFHFEPLPCVMTHELWLELQAKKADPR